MNLTLLLACLLTCLNRFLKTALADTLSNGLDDPKEKLISESLHPLQRPHDEMPGESDCQGYPPVVVQPAIIKVFRYPRIDNKANEESSNNHPSLTDTTPDYYIPPHWHAPDAQLPFWHPPRYHEYRPPSRRTGMQPLSDRLTSRIPPNAHQPFHQSESQPNETWRQYSPPSYIDRVNNNNSATDGTKSPNFFMQLLRRPSLWG